MPIGPLGLFLEDGCSGSLDPQTACCELGFVPLPYDAGKITYFLHVAISLLKNDITVPAAFPLWILTQIPNHSDEINK